MAFKKNNINRVWENWATAKEIAQNWDVSPRRVRQILESYSVESATLVHDGVPTIVYKLVSCKCT